MDYEASSMCKVWPGVECLGTDLRSRSWIPRDVGVTPAESDIFLAGPTDPTTDINTTTPRDAVHCHMPAISTRLELGMSQIRLDIDRLGRHTASRAAPNQTGTTNILDIASGRPI